MRLNDLDGMLKYIAAIASAGPMSIAEQTNPIILINAMFDGHETMSFS